jgi:hypothetical protein
MCPDDFRCCDVFGHYFTGRCAILNTVIPPYEIVTIETMVSCITIILSDDGIIAVFMVF